MTARLRATTGRARAIPRLLAIFMPPSAKSRPFAAAREQRMRRLVKRHAGKFVAASADPALDVHLTELLARRRQAEMRVYAPRMLEAIGSIDRGVGDEGRNGTGARNAHQSATNASLRTNSSTRFVLRASLRSSAVHRRNFQS